MNQIKRTSKKYRYDPKPSGEYAGNAYIKVNKDKVRRL